MSIPNANPTIWNNAPGSPPISWPKAKNNPKIAQAAVKPAIMPGGLFMVIPVDDSIL